MSLSDVAGTRFARHASEPLPTITRREQQQMEMLKVRRASKLKKELMQPIDWLWRGLIAQGDFVMLSADPKAGKSTFLGPLVASIVEGEPFLGKPVRKRTILFAAEESDSTVARRFAKLGVIDNPNLKQIYSEMRLPGDFELLKQASIDHEADVLLIDTLGTFFDIKNENSNAEMSSALRELAVFSHKQKVTIILAHHTAASGKAYRGASAIFAAVDQLITLTKVKKSKSSFHPLHRKLAIEGRYSCEGPSEMKISLTGKPQLSLLHQPYGYDLVEETWNDEEMQLLECLPPEKPGLKADDIRKRYPKKKATILRQLNDLFKAGMIDIAGTGKKGDAKLYYRVDSVPLLSVA
jgi:AAA domain